jgi:hypothetical protein
LEPRLEQLTRKTRLVIMKVNINRSRFQGIDWQSPVARQFELRTVPYLVLLDEQGKLIAEGQQAMDMVLKLMQEVGVQ